MSNNNSMWVIGHKITPHNPSGNYDMVIGETPPNVPGPPPHHHKNLKELFFVLEGEMEFMVNGKTIKVSVGDSVDLPPNTVHTFQNVGNTQCRWINIHSPKGFLSFFNEFGVDSNEDQAFEKSVDPNIIKAVIQKAEDFDMIIEEELK